MTPINKKRLIVAGLVSGAVLIACEFVVNEVILPAEWYLAFERLGIALDPGVGAAAIFVAAILGLGLCLIWLYASLIPRYGKGPKTAVISALFLWLVVYFFSAVWMGLLNLLPLRMLVILTLWGLGECVLAALAAYGIYRD